jgi:hypothetical protein
MAYPPNLKFLFNPVADVQNIYKIRGYSPCGFFARVVSVTGET